MYKVKQKFKHNPPETYGDCQRTVLACLLEVPPDSIPNFGVYYGKDKEWEEALTNWLKSRGLDTIQTIYDGDLEKVLRTQKNINPGRYYMLCGVSANGTNHVVIGLDDQIVWDPAIDDSGIVGPSNQTGYYHVEFLVPRFMNAADHPPKFVQWFPCGVSDDLGS